MSGLRPVWVEKALGQLAALHEPSDGWSYQPGNAVAVEPTVLASFALTTSEHKPKNGELVGKAAQWLASLQQENGAIGVTSNLPSPAWATPYGILLWAYLESHHSNMERAVAFLLAREGRRLPKSSGPGHDTTLAGWPWVSGTHSWLEPTALSLLALVKAGHSEHPRVDEAVRLVHDRALSSGGWNHGNTIVFGTELRAQPGPTGLALLALAGVKGADPGTIKRASEYLLRSLPKIGSPRAIGWGVLGLSAWEMELESTPELLEKCFSKIQQNPTPMDLALLVLAAENEPKRFFI